MSEYTLKMIFNLEADKCGVINTAQLRNLLIMEKQKRFDQMLINDLVDEFGSNGFVDYDQFRRLWLYLGSVREPFEYYARDGELSERKFGKLLANQLDTYIHKITVKSMVNFYKGRLTFDACVHALKHLGKVKNYCLQSNYITLEDYRQLVHTQSVQPTAPLEDNLPSYDEVMSW